MRQLVHECRFTVHSNAVAAGSTDIEPTNGIDMQANGGYDSIAFVVTFGAITAAAVTGIRAQQSTVIDGTGDTFADITGSAQVVADDKDSKAFVIDIARPTERFVRCVVDRATQNAVVESILAIQYNGGKRPVTQDTTVSAFEILADAIEGTA